MAVLWFKRQKPSEAQCEKYSIQILNHRDVGVEGKGVRHVLQEVVIRSDNVCRQYAGGYCFVSHTPVLTREFYVFSVVNFVHSEEHSTVSQCNVNCSRQLYCCSSARIKGTISW